MTKRILSFARTARFLPLWAVIAALLPTESSALIPCDLPSSAPFFVTDWVICRNDPINNVDPTGLRAYGSDYKGPIEEPWDWRVEYSQKDVDRVYAYLAGRDRHVYNPGLDNTSDMRANNADLLSRVLGVPVALVENKTLAEGGHVIGNSGHAAIEVVGESAEYVGGKLDFLVALYGKGHLPILSKADQAVRQTKSAYESALTDVRQTDGTVYGWMHSEGAIHGGIVIPHFSADYKRLNIVTLGGANHVFPEGVRATHYLNVNKRGQVDAVGRIAGGEMWSRHPKFSGTLGSIPLLGKPFRHRAKIEYNLGTEKVNTWYSDYGDEDYIHGFATYLKYTGADRAKVYFQAGADAVLAQ